MKHGDIVTNGKIVGIYLKDGVQSGTRNPGIVIREPSGRETWVARHMVHIATDVKRVFVLTRIDAMVLGTMQDISSASTKTSPEDALVLGILEAAKDERIKTRQSRKDAVEYIAVQLYEMAYTREVIEHSEIVEALEGCIKECLVGYVLE